MAVPHYPTVPIEWQHPFGPYRQAPAEYGGEWYYVSPFAPEPWLTGPSATEPPASGYGHLKDPFYQEWNDNLKAFKGIKLPAYITQAQADTANEVFRAWGMGAAAIYEGRYGFSARFPDTGEYEFDIDARTAVTS